MEIGGERSEGGSDADGTVSSDLLLFAIFQKIANFLLCDTTKKTFLLSKDAMGCVS
jgi:hypothetical protein